MTAPKEAVRRYWVDSMELMNVEKYNEPYCGGLEASVVVSAADHDAEVAVLRAALKWALGMHAMHGDYLVLGGRPGAFYPEDLPTELRDVIMREVQT